MTASWHMGRNTPTVSLHAHPQMAQCVGEPPHLLREFHICQRAYSAIFGLGNHGHFIPPGASQMLINAVRCQIRRPAYKPARPLHATGRVYHLLIRREPEPSEVPRHRVPVPGDVFD